AVCLANLALTTALGWAAQSLNPRLRLLAELQRLRQEIALLREESRIKDVRMQQIEAQNRPHYPPVERLAILEIRGARAWSLVQTARSFLVTPATIASWAARTITARAPSAAPRSPRCSTACSNPPSSPASSRSCTSTPPPAPRSRTPRPSACPTTSGPDRTQIKNSSTTRPG